MWEEKTKCTFVFIDFCFILMLNKINLTLLLPKPQQNDSKKKKIRRRDEKMTRENKNFKDGKSVGMWKLNSFVQLYILASLTKSEDKKMITMTFFS